MGTISTFVMTINTSSSQQCLLHSPPSARPHALRPCARQPRGCYFNWLWPFVMLRATPQLYAQPRPCSGSIRLMGRPQSIPPKHKRTHIGVCSLDTNRRAVLARILLDGSATLDAARAAIGHGAAIRPADLRVPALVSGSTSLPAGGIPPSLYQTP